MDSMTETVSLWVIKLTKSPTSTKPVTSLGLSILVGRTSKCRIVAICGSPNQTVAGVDRKNNFGQTWREGDVSSNRVGQANRSPGLIFYLMKAQKAGLVIGCRAGREEKKADAEDDAQ